MLRLTTLACFSALIFVARVSIGAILQKNVDPVQWYVPTIEHALDASHADVLFRGRVKPGVKIQIEKGAVAIFHSNRIQKLSFKDLGLKSSEIVSKANGQFKITVALPYAHVEIPLVATDKHAHPQQYLLLLDVTKSKVKMSGTKMVQPFTKWTVYLGPTLKVINWSQSNSAFSARHGSALLGSTVGASYSLNDKNLVSLALTSVQANGSLPSGNNYTFSDFEYSLEYEHIMSWQPFRGAKVASDFSYTMNNAPAFNRDSSGSFTFDPTTINNFGLGVSSLFSFWQHWNGVASLGLLYGGVEGAGLISNFNLLGAYARYSITHPLSSQFYIFSDILVQYETFDFSAYDPPSGMDLNNSMKQTAVTTDAGIQFRF